VSGNLLANYLPLRIQRKEDYSTEELHHVRAVVCSYSEDADDARTLLVTLGLLDDEEVLDA
jgi:hypothetical protein